MLPPTRNTAITTQDRLNPATKLDELISHQAARRPAATALIWQGQRTSYAELEQRIHLVAGAFAASGEAGERVAILAWNRPEFVELLYAVPASGKILVPLNARLAPAELIYQIQQAGVTTIIADDSLLTALLAHPDLPAGLRVLTLGDEYEHWLTNTTPQPLPATQDTDTVWILYTSGTTGRPKGAVLTHRSFMAGLKSGAQGRPVREDDIYLYPFPLFHVAAHNVFLQHQYGAAVVLLKSFDPAATLAGCQELKITSLSLAPTMIAMLLDHPDFSSQALASVRAIGYGASSMPETLLRRVLKETDAALSQGYGMTELSGSVAFLSDADHRRAASEQPELLKSVGLPVAGIELKLVDDDGADCATGETGEIVIKAEQVMQKYWQQAEASAATLVDGWLHTGDIGRFDEQGYLYIVDRKKDMIISGGENVASREVEEALRQHPAIKDVAVVGLPHPKWGEMVCAAVLLRSPVADVELDQHCRGLLAGYKTPKRFVVVEQIPVNANGKVDKPKIRQQLGTD